MTPSHPHQLEEQLRYLSGVMHADARYRYNWDLDIRPLLSAAGGKNLAFWRGVVEESGMKLMMRMNNSIYHAPWVEVSGSPFFLASIFEFVYDNYLWFDRGGLAYRQCRKGRVLMRGTRAFEFVGIVWPKQEAFGKPYYAAAAAEIRAWRPAAGLRANQQAVEDVVSFRMINAARRLNLPRQSYKESFCGK